MKVNSVIATRIPTELSLGTSGICRVEFDSRVHYYLYLNFIIYFLKISLSLYLSINVSLE